MYKIPIQYLTAKMFKCIELVSNDVLLVQSIDPLMICWFVCRCE